MRRIFALFLLGGVITLTFTLFLAIPEVRAQNGNDDCDVVCPAGSICIPNPLKACTFDKLVEGIIGFLIMLATPLAALMIVIAGFYFVTSSGNPRQIETAKTIILYTLVGYGIILISYGLIKIVKQILTGP